MNLGLGDYGSDSGEGESDDESGGAPPMQKPVVPPTQKQKRAPKKVTIGLPTLKPADDVEDDLEPERPAKKPRLAAGAGVSSLVSMLPAPKQKNPVLPAPQRVLGGGGGPGPVFDAPRSTVKDYPRTVAEEPQPDEAPAESSAASFRPSSLAKGRSNISLEEGSAKAPPRTASSAPAVDFFSLGSTSSPRVASGSATPSLPTVSSAPVIPQFEPPEPTPTDPYPGYYTLPSGQWAAYEPEYYAKFAKKWQTEYDAHVRALEKGQVKGFEGLDSAALEEVDAMKEMEKAKREVQEREARKAVTRGSDGVPAAPNIKLTASKSSGIARSRHQLATMLHEAYSNRDALEDKIAEGRRNRKEAGNKYGF